LRWVWAGCENWPVLKMEYARIRGISLRTVNVGMYVMVPLGDMYHRLFDLYVNKQVTVAEMFVLGWNEGGEALRWRRRLWVWEEE